ncbi:MAG: glycosyltransferase family 2 protein [Pseudomonadota bacterium]
MAPPTKRQTERQPAAKGTPEAQHGVTLVSYVENEAPYLLEWIAWHVLLGADRFVLVSHGGRDGSDAMLARLAELGPLETVALEAGEVGTFPFADALDKAFEHPTVQASRWVLPLAIDEFLDISAGQGTFADLISATAGERAGGGAGAADAIAIPWRMMGSNGARDFDPGPVTARCTRGSQIHPPEARNLHGYRTLFRPSAFARLSPRRPLSAADLAPAKARKGAAKAAKHPRWLNASGQDITAQMDERAKRPAAPLVFSALGYAHATIRRYALKSRTEFLFRQLHDSPSSEGPDAPKGWDAWTQRDINSRPFPPLGPGVLNAAIAELASDAKLAALQRAAEAEVPRKVLALANAEPAAARFLDSADTRAAAPDIPAARLLCIATHPRAASLWMRRTFREAARAHNAPFVEIEHPNLMRDIPNTGPAIVVNWQSRFPRAIFAHAEARILHIVRDPRDMLLSAVHYHRRASAKDEPDLHLPRPDLDGFTYAAFLAALPDEATRLRFEMDHRHGETAEDMLAWALGRSNTIELRYEDLVSEPDCATMRGALERCAISGLDTETILASFWKHALFGGLADPKRADGRIRRHVTHAQPGRWRVALPRDVAVEYEARFGRLLRVLGYAEDASWVEECPETTPMAAPSPVTLP